jgi:hypothetical protein
MPRKKKLTKAVTLELPMELLMRLQDYAELFGMKPKKALQHFVTEGLARVEKSAVYRRRKEAVDKRVQAALAQEWGMSGLLSHMKKEK